MNTALNNSKKKTNFSSNTVSKMYEKSKGTFIINSHFNGANDISELIYQLLVKSDENKILYAK